MTRTDDATAALRDLYAAVRELTSGPPRPDELIDVLTLHPASLRRRTWVCGAVMRSWAARNDLVADVMQEATYLLIRRIRSGRLQFEDQGIERFRGWLWTIWHDTCRTAWRRCRSHLEERTGMPMDQVVEQWSGGTEEEALLPQVKQIIRRIEDPSLRQVMTDWAAGLSGAESGALLGRSESWVSKRRAEGVAVLRTLLEQNPT